MKKNCIVSFSGVKIHNFSFMERQTEVFDQIGGNHSINHVDFMIGTKDMKITGITEDGKEIPVFIDGSWAL